MAPNQGGAGAALGTASVRMPSIHFVKKPTVEEEPMSKPVVFDDISKNAKGGWDERGSNRSRRPERRLLRGKQSDDEDQAH